MYGRPKNAELLRENVNDNVNDDVNTVFGVAAQQCSSARQQRQQRQPAAAEAADTAINFFSSVRTL